MEEQVEESKEVVSGNARKGNRTNLDMAFAYNAWLDAMLDPDFRDMSAKEQVSVLPGASHMTYALWKKELSNYQWLRINDVCKEKIAKQEVHVDDAMYRKALEGDVAAAKLWYQKRLGWSEKQISEVINKDGNLKEMSNEELWAAALKKMPRAVVESALVGQKPPDAETRPDT